MNTRSLIQFVRAVIITGFVLSCTVAYCQDLSLKSRIKSEAQVMSQAIRDGEWETAAQRIPGEFLDQMGGIEGLKQTCQEAKATGGSDSLSFNHEIGDVTSIAKTEKFYVAIVKTTGTVMSGKGNGTIESYLIGLSKDNGASWAFIGGSDSLKERLIRKNPDMATKLVFPVRIIKTGDSTFTEVNGRWVPDEKTYREWKETAESMSKEPLAKPASGIAAGSNGNAELSFTLPHEKPASGQSGAGKMPALHGRAAEAASGIATNSKVYSKRPRDLNYVDPKEMQEFEAKMAAARDYKPAKGMNSLDAFRERAKRAPASYPKNYKPGKYKAIGE